MHICALNESILIQVNMRFVLTLPGRYFEHILYDSGLWLLIQYITMSLYLEDDYILGVLLHCNVLPGFIVMTLLPHNIHSYQLLWHYDRPYQVTLCKCRIKVGLTKDECKKMARDWFTVICARCKKPLSHICLWQCKSTLQVLYFIIGFLFNVKTKTSYHYFHVYYILSLLRIIIRNRSL